MPFINLRPDCAAECNSLPESFLSLWQKLALTTDQADPVCCGPAWNIAYYRIFNPRSRIFYLQSTDTVILFCEVVLDDGSVVLSPIDNGWFFGQPLLGHHALDLLDEALEIFNRTYGKWLPPVFVSGMQMGTPENLGLFASFSAKFDIYFYRSIEECYASLDGGLDGWLGRRSSNHRAKLRKAMRKAREQDVLFSRHRPCSTEEVSSLYDRIIAIERQSWKGLGKCGMAESPSREFYAELMEQYMRSHMAFVIFATQNGRDLGFVFGGGASGIYRGQQFSYIEDAKNLSIGNLLQLEQIKWLCELGFQRYDMGPITGPRMGYKEHWTEEVRESAVWCLKKA